MRARSNLVRLPLALRLDVGISRETHRVEIGGMGRRFACGGGFLEGEKNGALIFGGDLGFLEDVVIRWARTGLVILLRNGSHAIRVIRINWSA